LDFSPGNGTEGLVSGSNNFGVYYDFPLLTSDKVRFEIPFALTIPQFQHVWTDWPWNKGRKTLTTDLVFTKIEFRVMYDTISEYKTKFYRLKFVREIISLGYCSPFPRYTIIPLYALQDF
jgi:hypothetical protein